MPFAVPPTDFIVKGEAVGPSRRVSSSEVNDILGMINVRRGMRQKMTIGKPMAAIVWVMAMVAPNLGGRVMLSQR